MYHRIREPFFDPWDISVSQATFEKQLKELSSSCTVIRLSEINNALNRKIKNPAIITFDDGYMDNFQIARPLLIKYGLPATFYIPTGTLHTNFPFWWDELSQILLQTAELPEHCELSLPDFPVSFSLGIEASLTSEQLHYLSNWKATTEPLTRRTMLYKMVWSTLKSTTPEKCMESMAILREWSRLPCTDSNSCMGTAELIELSSDPLFDIGAHSISHPLLQTLPATQQSEEIMGSKNHLEKLLGKEIASFAYPYGGFSEVTTKMVENAGFHFAVSTEKGSITKKQAQGLKYTLPRLQVTEDFEWKI